MPEEHLTWTGSVPRSTRFDDVYYSVEDGLAESRHVFLDGNHLAQRLAALPDRPDQCFRVGETGFGTGLNILALWQLWQQTGHRHARLEILSAEAWPLAPETLVTAHQAWPELTALSARLVSLLPPPLPGTHVLPLEPGRVTLTLLHGDASRQLATHETCVDAWFLDGFAPAKNPEMWTPAVFAALARLSHPGTTLATFTSAGVVRRGLAEAGFTVSRTAGFGRKRDMSVATFAGPRAVNASGTPWFNRPDPLPAGNAVVIGGGLAGCAASRVLAERGWQVTLLERGPALADGASGNPAGMTYLRPSTKDTAQNRYYRSCWLFALRRIRDVMQSAGFREGDDFSLNGIVTLPPDDGALREAAAFIGWPGGDRLLQACTTENLTRYCGGMEAASQGFLLSGAGWVHPPSLCAALASHERIRVVTGQEVMSIVRHGTEHWLTLTTSLQHLSSLVVIANSLAAAQFAPCAWLPQNPVRGQITLIPATTATAGLHHVINHDTYVTPARNGMHCIGATFQPGSSDLTPRPGDNDANLAGLRQALPGWPDVPPTGVSWRVGIRSGAPDYLPYVGPLPDVDAFERDYGQALRKGQLRRDLPLPVWQKGLYCSLAHGSRGITSALLAAEILGGYVSGDGLPVERDVLDALHPARALIRAWRRRQA